MANIPFKSITFPGLPNKYTVPEISSDLMTAGKAADAKATGDALSALEDAVGDELSDIKADLGAIDSLEPVQSTSLLSPFLPGGVDQNTGEINPDKTNQCYFPKTPMAAGDSISCHRFSNKITTTCKLVIYDESGEFVSGRAFGNGQSVTFDTAGIFVIGCTLNAETSATMEEAIVAANASFTATLTSESAIVKTVKNVDSRVTAIEESGALEVSDIVIQAGMTLKTADLLRGKYYKVENGVVSQLTETSAYYCRMVDVSGLVGKKVVVTTNARRGGSVRSFGFCDSENAVGSYCPETSIPNVATGVYRKILLVDKPYFFFSVSSDASNITIEIAPEYVFYDKNTVDFRLDAKKFYHFSFDDVILCLQDITTNAGTYTSIFDNEFFAWCKRMHDRYGVTFSMYVFYANDADNPTWTLEDCTDTFAEEFTANSDWLRFGFHAYAQGTTATSRAATIADDYADTIAELVRITGSVKCIDRMPRLQSYTGTLAALQAIRDCDLGCVGFLASKNDSASVSRDSYYFDAEQNAYIDKHIYMYDAENHLHFVKTSYIWGSDTSPVTIENSIQWFNANKYVELFTHENQLTSGTKSTFESKFAVLCNEHLPVFMMDMIVN